MPVNSSPHKPALSDRPVSILKAILVVLGCLILAVGSVLWVAAMMESLFYYRSPLSQDPPEPGAGTGVRSTRRLVIVLVDALREDTALDPQVMPFLASLYQQGASATMHSRPPSYSQPGYATILTGSWTDINDGPAANLDYAEIPVFTQDDLFSATRRAGLKTAVSGYYWFEKLLPPNSVSASFYTEGEDHIADEQVVASALPWLQADAYQLVLVHLDQVDYAGHHEGGPHDPRWNEAARRADNLIRQVAAPLDLTQDTLLVLSDHGQIDSGGHGGDEEILLIEPFVLAGAGVIPGSYGDIKMVDVAPTLAVLLGANIPATSQGRPLTEMLALIPEQITVVQELSTSQQRLLLEKYSQAIGRPVEMPADPSVEAHQRVIVRIQAQRLIRESLYRLIPGLLLLSLPAMLFVRFNRAGLWLVGCALLYVLFFNVMYILVTKNTYSLSWVSSPQELLGVLGSLALTCFFLSWLVLAISNRFDRLKPSQLAGRTMSLVLTSVYVLSWPVMISAILNGLLITWTLPDMRILYVAFLSLMQIPVVVFSGFTLACLAALGSWLASQIHGHSRGSDLPA